MPEENIILEFKTRDGSRKKLAISLRLLAADGDEVLRRLQAEGLEIAPGAEALVLQYLIQQSASLKPGPAG
jgi:Domain of unknown function (DUF927)